MAFPTSPADASTTITNGISYIYSATNKAWKRVQSGFTTTVFLSVGNTLTIGTSVINGTATSAVYMAGTSPTTVLTPAGVWAAANPVSLNDAATITMDLSTAMNFTCTLTTAVGATRILGNPANGKAGQTGWIRINQSNAGSPGQAMTFGTNWYWAGGSTGTLSTATTASTDILYYTAISPTYFVGSLVKNVR